VQRTVSLSAGQLLDAVDAGVSATVAERGRALLACVLPEPSDQRLGETSLAVRDAWLLDLRCATFGRTLKARVICPACSTHLALEIPRESVPLEWPQAERLTPEVVHLGLGENLVQARSPDGDALERAARCPDARSARESLISSCVTVRASDGGAIDATSLDAGDLERIGDAIASHEPGVEMALDVSCASCGHQWKPVLDILLFFWRELSSTSVQLLDEVHEMALTYGWSEDEILRLSSRRRHEYVERLTRV
jgi:hypothetical protein